MSRRPLAARTFSLSEDVLIERYMLRGYGPGEIAEELNANRPEKLHLTYQQVYDRARQIRKRFRAELGEYIEDQLYKTLRSLDTIERMAAEGFALSQKEDTEQRVVEEGRIDGADGTKFDFDTEQAPRRRRELTKRTAAGNKEFLDVMLNVNKERARIMGFGTAQREAGPQEQQQPIPDANAIVPFDIGADVAHDPHLGAQVALLAKTLSEQAQERDRRMRDAMRIPLQDAVVVDAVTRPVETTGTRTNGTT